MQLIKILLPLHPIFTKDNKKKMEKTEHKMKIANRDAFLIIGVIEASWAPMVPYVKKGFGLNEAELGLLLLCTGLGSLLALPMAGIMCKRYGAKLVTYVNAILLAATLVFVAANINVCLTAAMLVIFGCCTVQIDVAANVNGVTLEENFHKNMMSGFHGGYSLGTLIGAAVMSVLLTVGVGILPAAIVVLACTLTYFFWGCRGLLGKGELDTTKHPTDSPVVHRRLYIPPLVIVVGMVCFVFYSTEGAVMSWSAVFVNQERGVDLRYAGYFYTAFAIAMTTMRLLGNKLVNRFGAKRVVVSGASLVTVGFLTVALIPSVVATATGFAITGIGAANVVPQIVSYAGKIKGMAIQNTISTITALGYSGSLLGPVIIGFCAHTYGLPATFTGIAVVVAMIVFVIRYLYTRDTNDTH